MQSLAEPLLSACSVSLLVPRPSAWLEVVVLPLWCGWSSGWDQFHFSSFMGFCLKGQMAHFKLKYKYKLMTETMGMIGEIQHECSPEAWPDIISQFTHFILVLQLCGWARYFPLLGRAFEIFPSLQQMSSKKERQACLHRCYSDGRHPLIHLKSNTFEIKYLFAALQF